jgi:hypothetical protein
MIPEFDHVVGELEELHVRLMASEGESPTELLRRRGDAILLLEQLAAGGTCSAEQLARLMKIHSEGQLLWARLSGSRQATLRELTSLARDTQLVSSLLAGVKRPPNVNCVG